MIRQYQLGTTVRGQWDVLFCGLRCLPRSAGSAAYQLVSKEASRCLWMEGRRDKGEIGGLEVKDGGALQHTGEREMKKGNWQKKKPSYLFHSVDLKNAQEGSMTEELIGFISHYLSFPLTLTLPLSASLSRSPTHILFAVLDTLSHHQTCACTIKTHFSLIHALSTSPRT